MGATMIARMAEDIAIAAFPLAPHQSRHHLAAVKSTFQTAQQPDKLEQLPYTRDSLDMAVTSTAMEMVKLVSSIHPSTRGNNFPTRNKK